MKTTNMGKEDEVPLAKDEPYKRTVVGNRPVPISFWLWRIVLCHNVANIKLLDYAGYILCGERGIFSGLFSL